MKAWMISMCLALPGLGLVGAGCDKKAEPPAAPTEPAPTEAKPTEPAATAPETPPAEPAVDEAKPAEPVADSPLVQKAKALAALRDAIRADPDNAAAALEKAGMTEAELEAALFEVAEDPAASAAYAGQ